MENEINCLPQHRSDVYIDGYTYRLAVRFQTGGRESEGELPHSHAQHELHAIFQGEASLELEGEPALMLHAGECCLIPPHVYHLRRLGTGAIRYCVLSIDCPRGAPMQLQQLGCVLLQCADVLMGYLTALEEELNVQRIGADSSIQSLFTLLLTAILREVTAPQPEPLLSNRVPISRREDYIDGYFARNYWYDISARDLAGHIGITTRQLARIMQQQYGCTFRQHLLKIRLYHARQLLNTTGESVSRIATACGFTCQGAFATAFRKHVGCTPSQYRRRGKSEG